MPTIPDDPVDLALALIAALAAEQRGLPHPGPTSADLGRIPPRVVTITAGRVAEILDDELGIRLVAEHLPTIIAAARRSAPGVADGLDPGATQGSLRSAAAAAREYALLELADEVSEMIPGDAS